MNPYTTRTRARIQSCDLARALLTDPSTAALSLAALERQRGWQAEAEVERLLRQYGVAPASTASLVLMLRQTIGAALVRAGERLAAAPPRGASQAAALSDGTLRTAS